MNNSTEEYTEVDLELGSRRQTYVASMKKEIGELSQVQRRKHNKLPSICRVHDQLRKQDPEAYEPKVVSIGPLHHGKKNLIPMENTKFEILGRILHGKPDNTLDVFFHEVCKCLDEVREEYSEKVELTDEEFARLLVIDGCFLIVLCTLYVDFPIIDMSDWTIQFLASPQYLHTDLWLLENQIPFFVVNKLFLKMCGIYPILGDALPNCISLFLKSMRINLPKENYPKEENVRHLLHLMSISRDPSLLPDEPHQQSSWQQARILVKQIILLISMPFLGLIYLILFRDCSGLICSPKGSHYPDIIRTAAELHEVGIKFQTKATPKERYTASQMKISFRNGTLEIPPFSVNSSTCLRLRNLIAFEKSSNFSRSSHVTHYCFFLDNLINTSEDVGILRRRGILKNRLGCDSELAKMMNSLCKDVVLRREKDPYAKLRGDVQKFCQVPHNRWRASLVQNYFQNPWTIFSLMAAIILVVFTVTQTCYTMYPRK